MTTMRERLLSKTNKRYREVKLPDGDVVTIRNLSERERSQHELQGLNQKTGAFQYAKMPDMKLQMIGLCLVDGETKEQLLSGDEWRQLGDLDSSVVACIYSACLEHNGYEKKEVEELVGNSD